MEHRDKPGGEGRRIGRAPVLLHAANLRVAVAHCDRELALGEAHPAAQIFEQVAKGGKLLWGDSGGAAQGGLLLDKKRSGTRLAAEYSAMQAIWGIFGK